MWSPALDRLMMVLTYSMVALLAVHVTWNALASRRITAWLEAVGVLLLALSVAAVLIHPTMKFDRSGPGGTEVFGPDEPYFTIVKVAQLAGAALVVGGLATDVVKRVANAMRNHRGASDVGATLTQSR